MNRGLADTSLYIGRESRRSVDESQVSQLLAVSVVTYAELRAGVLAADDPAVRNRRLATLELITQDDDFAGVPELVVIRV